jgi:single-strand DNA-binding protein
MKGLNKVTLIGHLGQEPEVKYLDNGTPVATFSIATSEQYTDKSGQKQTVTEWHNIVAWRHLAEIVKQYVHKGDPVYIEGKLQTRNWDDQNGVKRYTTEINARDLIMLGARQGGAQPTNDYSSAPMGEQKVSEPIADAPANESDDLPF